VRLAVLGVTVHRGHELRSLPRCDAFSIAKNTIWIQSQQSQFGWAEAAADPRDERPSGLNGRPIDYGIHRAPCGCDTDMIFLTSRRLIAWANLYGELNVLAGGGALEANSPASEGLPAAGRRHHGWRRATMPRRRESVLAAVH
jgi:hypothetical protein